MSGLVLLEIDSVCVRFSFTRNGLSVSGLVILEIDSVCVKFSFTKNGFSVCLI